MRSPITALLGPTNTGKTFIAVERMLAHRTGMAGFPLRLLARENFERVVALRGADKVALVTGEERIVPRAPSYFICTVEAMPVDRPVDFLVVDEIQLAADRERGHVFTNRLLHARGREETWFVGAETMRPLVKKLLPEAAILSRPRLSTLSYTAPRRLERLPRRTAVVVFSLSELYEVAEAMRRKVGGVALVFGALSPRTRNAQVALYQAGEVDYLVATDAIGMGLNLDIDHVAFTGLTKFDGLGRRLLRPDEIAQVAGRAGRHVKDGTFGPTEELGDFDPRLVSSLEAHRFPPLSSIYWRSADLDFDSPAALLQSLERPSPRPELVRTRPADDHRAFEALARTAPVAALLHRADDVRLLFEVAQIPDFQAVLTDAHTRLLHEAFVHLSGPAGRLPEDWVEPQVRRLDRTEGDMDVLLSRIAAIRTWTYISHRAGWLTDPGHWQERTRGIEDRLSDTLHERLTAQFVDRRATVIARHEPSALLVEVDERDDVLVQGLLAGRLEGFRFRPDPSLRDEARGLLAAANRGLRTAARERVRACEDAPDAAFSLSPEGRLLWRGAEVGRLGPGESSVAPLVEPLTSELLNPPLREQVRRRLQAFVDAEVRRSLGPLLALRDAPLFGVARGLAFALVKGLGSVPRRAVDDQLQALGPDSRRELSRLGVTLGRHAVYQNALLKPEAIRLRVALALARYGAPAGPLPDARPSLEATETVTAFYSACGYEPMGPRLVRVDVLDRFAADVRRAAGRGPFKPDSASAGRLGCPPGQVAGVLRALGYVERGGGFFSAGGEGRERKRGQVRRA
jgi:ATP-dependent RNA helicase SUPV3L1/SUV3